FRRVLFRSVCLDTYDLVKFKRSNQSTCITQKPVGAGGQTVKGGQVLADGPAIDRGDLALGRDVLVAFMPWGGYNFEDAILISERLVPHAVFTSSHIEEFDVEARETKVDKDERSKSIESDDVMRIQREHQDSLRIVEEEKNKKIRKLLLGKVVARDLMDGETGEIILKRKGKITPEILKKLSDDEVRRIVLSDPEDQKEIEET